MRPHEEESVGFHSFTAIQHSFPTGIPQTQGEVIDIVDYRARGDLTSRTLSDTAVDRVPSIARLTFACLPVEEMENWLVVTY